MARKNGTTTARGYGNDHQALRRQWAERIKLGGVSCWRCGRPIHPTHAWDLGHDDHDRTIYRGPEHRHENRAAGARKTNAIRRARTRRRNTQRRTTTLTW